MGSPVQKRRLLGRRLLWQSPHASAVAVIAFAHTGHALGVLERSNRASRGLSASYPVWPRPQPRASRRRDSASHCLHRDQR